MSDTWMMSNRQPWVEALLRGIIRSKTRSLKVTLPPVGSGVFLHASQAMWKYWYGLQGVFDGFAATDPPIYPPADILALPRGGVVGFAIVEAVGPTMETMPAEDRHCFIVNDYILGEGHIQWDCADSQTIVFRNVVRLPFIPCRGAQVPTRKLPPELRALPPDIDRIDWLVTVPSSDVNFKSQLERSSDQLLRLAIQRLQERPFSKTAIRAIERELRRRAKKARMGESDASR